MKRKTWLILASLVVVAVPLVAMAQGLVPCSGARGDECQLCKGAQLIDNVVTWLVAILSIIAAILIAYSGFKLVTSAGNVAAKSEAKRMVSNVIIGFVIVLAAWLGIDLMMQMLVGEEMNGPWEQIQCVAQPQSEIVSVGLANGSMLRYVCEPDPNFPGVNINCGNLIAQCEAQNGLAEIDNSDPNNHYVECRSGGGTHGVACSQTGPGEFNCSAQQAQCERVGGTAQLDYSDPTQYVVNCTLPQPSGGDGAQILNCARTGPDTFDCAGRIAECTGAGGTATPDLSDPNQHVVACTFPVQAGAGSCQVLQGGPCSPSNLQQYFGANANVASQICNKESGGQPVRSQSDICCGPGGNCAGAPSFSGGYFQINILANDHLVPGCNMESIFQKNCIPGERCQTEGSCVRRNGNGICTGWSCTIEVNSMYSTCMQGAINSAVNLEAARALSNGGVNWNPWRNSANLCSIP